MYGFSLIEGRLVGPGTQAWTTTRPSSLSCRTQSFSPSSLMVSSLIVSSLQSSSPSLTLTACFRMHACLNTWIMSLPMYVPGLVCPWGAQGNFSCPWTKSPTHHHCCQMTPSLFFASLLPPHPLCSPHWAKSRGDLSFRIPAWLFFFFLTFIYLAAPGLRCSVWDLWSLLGHVGFSSLTRARTWAPCTGSVEF